MHHATIACRLDPLSLIINEGPAFINMLHRRYDESLRLYQAAAELDPLFYMVHTSMGRLYAQMGHALLGYSWPGNVRELENAIERAVVMCDGPMIEREHLPMATDAVVSSSLGAFVPGMTLAELERLAILRTLEHVGGSTARAAEMLGISRRKIQYRLKEWGQPMGDDEEASEADA